MEKDTRGMRSLTQLTGWIFQRNERTSTCPNQLKLLDAIYIYRERELKMENEFSNEHCRTIFHGPRCNKN